MEAESGHEHPIHDEASLHHIEEDVFAAYKNKSGSARKALERLEVYFHQCDIEQLRRVRAALVLGPTTPNAAHSHCCPAVGYAAHLSQH